MAKQYGRHAPAADEIYCTMMAERTGEDPGNYRNRPFDMELLFHAPSAPEEPARTASDWIEATAAAVGVDLHPEPPQAWKWPTPKGTPIAQQFGPAPAAHTPPGGHPDPRSLPGYPFLEEW